MIGSIAQVVEDIPGTANALDFYAGDGRYEGHILDRFHLTSWEINPKLIDELRRNCPNAEVVNGDSYQLAKRRENWGRFNLIVFDNSPIDAEHFKALPYVFLLLRDEGGTVVFNLLTDPNRYYLHRLAARRLKPEKIDFDALMEARRRFYGSDTITEQYAETFYKRYFARQAFTVQRVSLTQRVPHLYWMRLDLT